MKRRAMSLVSVAALSAAFGLGGAFLEAYIVSRPLEVGQALMGLSVAWLGLICGLMLGIALYVAVFKRELALSEFLIIGVLSIVTGCVAAFFVPPPGWWAGIVTVTIALGASAVMIRLRTSGSATTLR